MKWMLGVMRCLAQSKEVSKVNHWEFNCVDPMRIYFVCRATDVFVLTVAKLSMNAAVTHENSCLNDSMQQMVQSVPYGERTASDGGPSGRKRLGKVHDFFL